MAGDVGQPSTGGESIILVPLQSQHRRILPKPCDSYKPKVPKASKHVRPPILQRRVKGQCPIPECHIQNCRLRSHQNYQSWLRTRHTAAATSDNDICFSSSSSDDSQGDPDELLDFSIILGGVDGMPTLPIDFLQTPILGELLNTFFSHEWDRIITIISPPPVSAMQKRLAEQTKQEKLAMALSEPIFCLQFIAAAHFPISFRTGYRQNDKITTIIQLQIMSLLRKKMSEKEELHAYDVVVILALVMIEIATGHTDSLLAHRKAMKHLVTKLGGVHYMGDCIPFIHNLDRMICIFTDAPLCFPPLPHQIARRPFLHAYVYGSFFDPPTFTTASKVVMEYCFDSCRVIELIEEKGWTFTPVDKSTREIPDLHYIYYLRECLVNDFIQLNAQLTAEKHEIDRCILMTAKIVDYIVTQDNYVVAIPFHLANKVRDIVIRQLVDLLSWSQNRDILRWILFVLSSMPVPWNGRDWSLSILKKQLQIKYGSTDTGTYTHSNINTPWPLDWKATELENIQSFVWSNTRFHSSWEKTCNELDDSRIVELEV